MLDLRNAGDGDPFYMSVTRAQAMTTLLRDIVTEPLPVIGAIDRHTRANDNLTHFI